LGSKLKYFIKVDDLSFFFSLSALDLHGLQKGLEAFEAEVFSKVAGEPKLNSRRAGRAP
jgi:hypothetical protein